MVVNKHVLSKIRETVCCILTIEYMVVYTYMLLKYREGFNTFPYTWITLII